MIVIMLSDCPPKVRGDLSKWLCEINTGVFVGNVSSRVREEVWQRICENIKSGQATMVFSAPGEQKMDFRVHNTTWEPVELDGIKLMRRPLPSARASKMSEKEDKGISGAKAGRSGYTWQTEWPKPCQEKVSGRFCGTRYRNNRNITGKG